MANNKWNNNNYQSGKDYKKKSGAKLTKYENSNGQLKEVINAWNASKVKGFVKLTAYPLSSDGAKSLKNKYPDRYGKDYSNVTSNGNERWVYKAEVTPRDSRSKEFFSGIAIFKRKSKKLYVSRFGMVASCGKDYFGKIHVSSK